MIRRIRIRRIMSYDEEKGKESKMNEKYEVSKIGIKW